VIGADHKEITDKKTGALSTKLSPLAGTKTFFIAHYISKKIADVLKC
jgi:hypothetical protein